MTFDAIIVGGRCAGASLAMLLGRRGLKVLLLDAAELPSDKTTSTHFIWQSGTGCLKRWGLIKKLEATNCAPHQSYLLDLGGLELRGAVRANEDGMSQSYAPRRHVIDRLLLEEARAAGVEIQDGCKVLDMLRDGDRVAGVSYRDRQGGVAEARAHIVVGADGINSTIAELVGAETYNYRTKSQQIFFSYFKGVDIEDVEFYSRPGRMGFAWETNDWEVVAGFCCRGEDAKAMADDVAANYWRELATMSPSFHQRLKSAEQTAPVRMGGTPSLMRTAGGKGWALVGDAGLNMDPVSAAGISNAFIQAEMLADAISTGLDQDALDQEITSFAQARDEKFGPYFEFTADLAQLNPDVPDEVMQLFMALPGQQADIDAYFGVFAQTVPVTEFFDPANLQRIIAGSAVPSQTA
ncbi:NAD(P)/FAD-dependent oxidoreductase [Sulfitobacter sp. S190]|uniref:FAD-dependent oxidoreductase n=1 Tax=Sulfitobacter sp. S190 TaxID=2867022 RepID=UPI0021A93168|nr:NAD(P)/FAD-dependent oxidoreductase [Sulfitobacter sp. S190]UWR23901.1 NAD(P)/FAD-dependent oxidoreductase [Sulfitobacter sp. S190]